MSDTKKVLMGERVYQGKQWDEVLVDGQEYDLPVRFANWLIAGELATEVKPKRKPQAKKAGE